MLSTVEVVERGRGHLKVFLFLALAAMLFIRAKRRATLVEGHPRNIPVKLFQNSIYWLRRRRRLTVFLFLALAATLFIRAEPFMQFW